MYLQIKVIPKARITEFVEKMDDETLKFRLKALPEKGQANEALIQFLAKECKVESSEVRVISGQTGTRKLVRLPDNAQIPW